MHETNHKLIVPVGENIDDSEAEQLCMEILERIKKNSVNGVIIDVSAVKSLDSYIFSIFRDTARMISMMGVDPVFVGIPPGAASALVDLGIECDGISTTISMDDGMELLSGKVIE